MIAAASSKTAETYYVHPQALVESAEIGPNTRIWAFAHVLKGARIGADCNIGDHAFVESEVVLGNNVTVKNGVAIWSGVTIEDNVFLAPNCVFTNDRNPRSYIKKPLEQLSPTMVRANATIGANATILCGITIGTYAFIGAGAVVIRSVLDYALIVGNPGRQIGWMCHCAEKLDGPASLRLGARIDCVHCKSSFVRTEAGLSEVKLPLAGKEQTR
jgi:carbonic anhydrase/acetyltransferase-like protein (isoleucine patch superfamily)